MNDSRSKWNDDRLDDLARKVDQQARHSEQLARMDVELMEVKEDVRAIDKKTDGIVASLDRKAREDREATREAKAERRQDRRWFAGTGIAASSVLLAAIALLADKI